MDSTNYPRTLILWLCHPLPRPHDGECDEWNKAYCDQLSEQLLLGTAYGGA